MSKKKLITREDFVDLIREALPASTSPCPIDIAVCAVDVLAPYLQLDPPTDSTSCNRCDGAGTKETACLECDGTGDAVCPECEGSGRWPCPCCEGGITDADYCEDCNGTGIQES